MNYDKVLPNTLGKAKQRWYFLRFSGIYYFPMATPYIQEVGGKSKLTFHALLKWKNCHFTWLFPNQSTFKGDGWNFA